MFVTAALHESGARVFIDATKTPARIPFLAASDRIRLSVLHLVRDPLAQVCSSIGHRGGPASKHAKAWVRRQREISHLVGGVPDSRHLIIRYEDLCLEPVIELNRICAFLDLAPIPALDSYDSFEHHVIGNAMRKAKGSRAKIKLDTRWQKELDPEKRREIIQVSGEWADRFGYEPAYLRRKPQRPYPARHSEPTRGEPGT